MYFVYIQYLITHVQYIDIYIVYAQYAYTCIPIGDIVT